MENRLKSALRSKSVAPETRADREERIVHRVKSPPLLPAASGRITPRSSGYRQVTNSMKNLSAESQSDLIERTKSIKFIDEKDNSAGNVGLPSVSSTPVKKQKGGEKKRFNKKSKCENASDTLSLEDCGMFQDEDDVSRQQGVSNVPSPEVKVVLH